MICSNLFAMIRKLLFFIAVAVLNQPSAAQTLRPFGVKMDLTAALQGRIGAAFEWRFHQKSGFELLLDYQQHNTLPPDVFNGSVTVEYATRTLDSTRWGSSQPLNPADWSYLGTGRPLPALPSPFIALSTLHTRLGYRISYEVGRGHSRFFIQPAIHLSRHRYFESREQTIVTSDDLESWQVGSVPNELQVIRHTIGYRQSLEMRQRDAWLGGISYDIGIALQWQHRIVLEGRLTAGLNIGEPPYSEPQPPSSLRNFFGGLMLHAGYFFGKKRATGPAANF